MKNLIIPLLILALLVTPVYAGLQNTTVIAVGGQGIEADNSRGGNTFDFVRTPTKLYLGFVDTIATSYFDNKFYVSINNGSVWSDPIYVGQTDIAMVSGGVDTASRSIALSLNPYLQDRLQVSVGSPSPYSDGVMQRIYNTTIQRPTTQQAYGTYEIFRLGTYVGGSSGAATEKRFPLLWYSNNSGYMLFTGGRGGGAAFQRVMYATTNNGTEMDELKMQYFINFTAPYGNVSTGANNIALDADVAPCPDGNIWHAVLNGTPSSQLRFQIFTWNSSSGFSPMLQELPKGNFTTGIAESKPLSLVCDYNNNVYMFYTNRGTGSAYKLYMRIKPNNTDQFGSETLIGDPSLSGRSLNMSDPNPVVDTQNGIYLFSYGYSRDSTLNNTCFIQKINNGVAGSLRNFSSNCMNPKGIGKYSAMTAQSNKLRYAENIPIVFMYPANTTATGTNWTFSMYNVSEFLDVSPPTYSNVSVFPTSPHLDNTTGLHEVLFNITVYDGVELKNIVFDLQTVEYDYTINGTEYNFSKLFNISCGATSYHWHIYDSSDNVNTTVPYTYQHDCHSEAPYLIIFEPTGNYGNLTVPFDIFAINTVAMDICWSQLDFSGYVPNPTCSNSTITTTEGSHTIYLYANDSVGNVNFTHSNFYIDVTPPVIIKTSPAPTVTFLQTADNYLIPVTFTATDSGIGNVTCQYSVDGSPAINSSCTGFTLTLTNKDTHSVTIYASDALGNTGSLVFSIKVLTPELSGGLAGITGLLPLMFLIFGIVVSIGFMFKGASEGEIKMVITGFVIMFMVVMLFTVINGSVNTLILPA